MRTINLSEATVKLLSKTNIFIQSQKLKFGPIYEDFDLGCIYLYMGTPLNPANVPVIRFRDLRHTHLADQQGNIPF